MLLKKYDGKSCWTAYKLHFLCVVHSNAWTDDEACSFLKARLSGDAALVLAQARQPEWTLPMLLGALDLRYDVAAPAYGINARFHNLIQEENQTIDDYDDILIRARVKDLAAERIDQKALLEQFKYGLRNPKVKQYLCKRASETLADALRYANDCIAVADGLQEC